MDKIYSGNDRAKELKLRNYRELIAFVCAKSGEKWNGQVNESAPLAVDAFITWGRWSVTCPDCNNQMYAEPTDPIMFCDQCGNVAIDGDARLVNFPDNVGEIEAALLERKMGGNDVLREKFAGKMGASQTMLNPLFAPVDTSRDWRPGETVEKLRNEHAQVKEAKRQAKES